MSSRQGREKFERKLKENNVSGSNRNIWKILLVFALQCLCRATGIKPKKNWEKQGHF